MTAPTSPVTSTAPPPLAEGQWRIEDVVFGKYTEYPIWTAPEITWATIEDQDTDMPRGDGILFGRDRHGANSISFDMSVWSNRLGYDTSRLAKWWKNHPVRDIPGAAIPLDYCFEGEQRRVYGRPRNFSPTPGPTNREWIRVIADFQCIDDKFYSQEIFEHSVSIRPASIGGFSAPLSAPIGAVSSAESTATEFEVGGMTEAWLSARVQGPVSKPGFELYNEWNQNMPKVDMNFDQHLYISSYPWDRKIVDERGIYRGGVFDANSRKLSRLWLPPGEHELVMRGTDVTGTARVTLNWREAFPTM